jgi:hypothetical protein
MRVSSPWSLVPPASLSQPFSLLGCHKGGCFAPSQAPTQGDRPDLGPKSNGAFLTWTETMFSSLHNPLLLLLEPEASTVHLSIKSKKKKKKKQSNRKTEIGRKVVSWS